jgi:metallo-beta-lactamase superfamily protein
MDTVIPSLYASEPEPLGFGPSLEIRAFLLQRERGNLLLYRANTLEQDIRAVKDLGGLSRQYLNHRHEASPTCDWVANTFGAPLHCHENERRSVSEICNVDETFSERHHLDHDFEVIPTPGHTSGATAFLWDSVEHRCLFTGDTIYFHEGEWVAAVLDGVSDRERYIESLELIRRLDFDLIVPSVATAGQPYYAFTDKGDTQRRIDAILGRLRRGESH